MRKRLTIGLALVALVAAMLPGTALAGKTAEQKCAKAAEKLGIDPASYTIRTGGNGDDDVGDVDAGELVCGLNGDDVAAYVAGIFIGGNGRDMAQTTEWDGVVYGGNGDDFVDYVGYGAIFFGGNGDDSLAYLYGSTFDGGRGDDCVDDDVGGTLVSVEHTPCPAT